MAFPSHRRPKGFALFEMLLGLVVAVPLIYGATLLALAIAKASVDERVNASFISPVDGRPASVQVYRQVSSSVEAGAVAYHATLSSKLARASATYVFGAENIGPAPGVASIPAYVEVGALATAAWIDLAAENTQRTARAFIDRYGAALGGALPAGSPDNFSVVVIGPILSGEIRITAIAQVICAPATITGKGEALSDGYVQWARLWTVEGYLEYGWVIPERREGDQLWKPHASQFWLRLDDIAGIYEPGIAICRFPDPLPAIDAQKDGAANIARFVYAL